MATVAGVMLVFFGLAHAAALLGDPDDKAAGVPKAWRLVWAEACLAAIIGGGYVVSGRSPLLATLGVAQLCGLAIYNGLQTWGPRPKIVDHVVRIGIALAILGIAYAA